MGNRQAGAGAETAVKDTLLPARSLLRLPLPPAGVERLLRLPHRLGRPLRGGGVADRAPHRPQQRVAVHRLPLPPAEASVGGGGAVGGTIRQRGIAVLLSVACAPKPEQN